MRAHFPQGRAMIDNPAIVTTLNWFRLDIPPVVIIVINDDYYYYIRVDKEVLGYED